MDGAGRRKTLKERLGLSCCGASWGLTPSTISSSGVGDEESPPRHFEDLAPEINSDTGMNLATALAAEREYRAGLDGPEELRIRPNGSTSTPGTPFRVSLMRLLQESDGADAEIENGEATAGCCVCMGRKKGAAFIPCGHTFCRVCSRELWLNRGCCPLCNRPILEILDIF